jgi:hypothetical protein
VIDVLAAHPVFVTGSAFAVGLLLGWVLGAEYGAMREDDGKDA